MTDLDLYLENALEELYANRAKIERLIKALERFEKNGATTDDLTQALLERGKKRGK